MTDTDPPLNWLVRWDGSVIGGFPHREAAEAYARRFNDNMSAFHAKIGPATVESVAR